MNDLDLILAALLGQKIYDPASGLLAVYDELGAPVTNGGVLLRGTHGALLQWGIRQAYEPEPIGGGGGSADPFDVEQYLHDLSKRRTQEQVIAALLVAICTSGVLDSDADLTVRFN